jgi:hypothetical protein
MRDMEGGPNGVDYLAFGAGEDAAEVEMVQGWWPATDLRDIERSGA